MTDSNPYAPPADLSGRGPSAPAAPGPGSPPPGAVEQLRRTRPWTVFLAVLGFIGGGVMALAAMGMLIAAAAGEMGDESENALVLALSGFYAVATGLYLFVSILLFRYGRSIGYLLQFDRNDELVEALDAQRKVWKAMGVIAIVFMGLMLLALFAGIAVAIYEGM
jgi:hypothetical protein